MGIGLNTGSTKEGSNTIKELLFHLLSDHLTVQSIP